MGCPYIPDNRHRFVTNVEFYLYIQKPRLVSAEELHQQPSLKDFELDAIKAELQAAKKDPNVCLHGMVEEKIDGSESGFTISDDGINNVEYILEDYIETAEERFDGVIDEEYDEEKDEYIRPVAEITEKAVGAPKSVAAKIIQDLVWEYKRGIFYAGF